MAEVKEKLERRSSKSRLSKQDEIEEVEDEDNSPSSETSDATIVPAAGVETPVVNTPGGSPESSSPEEGNKKLEAQGSTDSDKSGPTQSTHPKVKVLVRSHALREDASPPPDEYMNTNILALQSASSSGSTATLSVASLSPIMGQSRSRHKLEKDGSQSSMSDTGTSPTLSRDSSVETQYTDSTGIDLECFIRKTLQRNPKDRMMLLKLEQDLTSFIKEHKLSFLKFPQMTSYHRMLVHRVAAFFGLDHNVDQSGKCVIVNRTSNTRIPDFKFCEHIREDGSSEDQPKKQILKRDSASFEEGRSPERAPLLDGKKSKSFEEREEEYEKARARIFSQQDSSSSAEGLLESPASSTSRPSTRHSSARSSKEDLRWAAEPRPWSSTDSSGYGTDTSTKHKVNMTKASSFGGVTVLSRGDSRTSTSSFSGGRISKTDSLSSAASTGSNVSSPMTRPPPIPSSPPPTSEVCETSSSQSTTSPTQSQSQAGESGTPGVAASSGPSAAGAGVAALPFTSAEQGEEVAVWVASSLDSIPAGSLIINPTTGQPYLNPDGSYYRYEPNSGIPQVQPTTTSQPVPSSSTTATAPPPPVPVEPQPVPAPPSAAYPHYSNTQHHTFSSEHRTFSGESSGSDLSQPMSTLTLTPQSSTESTESSCHQGPHSMYMVQHQQHPYMPSPQVPYYTGPSTPGAVQCMYPTMPCISMGPPSHMQGQTSVPSQGQGQQGQGPSPPQPQHNGQNLTQQYPSQPYVQNFTGYQVMGYPNMTVQSVETYGPQGYHQGVPQSYPVQQSHQSQGQGQEMTAGQTYPQYQHNGVHPMPVYYSSAGATGTSQGVTYPAPGGQVPMSVQGPYQPRKPPNQGIMAANGQSMTVNTAATVSVGQPMSMNNTSTTISAPQFVSYPPYPQMQAQRMQTQHMVSYPPVASQHSHQQGYPMVRPGMQMGMQIQTRTTPPPPPPQNLQVGQMPVLPASANQMKVYNVDQRPPKSVELYNPEAGGKDMGVAGLSGLAMAPGIPSAPMGHSGQVPMTAKPQMPQQICVAASPQFRAPNSVNPGDLRMLGQPVQQQMSVRPQLQPLFQPRPRLAGMSTQLGNKTSRTRNTLVRATSKDTTSSPNTSIDSTDSLDCGGCAILEVYDLPAGMKRAQAEGLLEELVAHGARLQFQQFDPNQQRTNYPVIECKVLALFESETAAFTVLANHKNPKYKLRPASESAHCLAGSQTPS